jgi:nucleoside phosphorylase
VVVVGQLRDGTRDAASVATDLLRSFPALRVVVMCGIAGGAVREWHGRPVELGDIVSATDGVVDYGHVRLRDSGEELRRPASGVSTDLLAADNELAAGERFVPVGAEPWRAPVDRALARLPAPPRASPPLVHRGAIGSADKLVRGAVARDGIAGRYGVCAVEMEGSGIAVATDLHQRRWYMVRGIADRADATKDDSFHEYAALAAAGYVRALLAAAPNLDGGPPVSSAWRMGSAALGEIVEALLGLPVLRDDYLRRGFLGLLPDHIRTQMVDHQVARLHVVALVQACERFEDGRDALVAALRAALGEGTELDRVLAVIERCWPPPTDGGQGGVQGA